MRPQKWLIKLPILLICLLLTSCSSVGFLSQAGRGQLEMLQRSRPVEQVINDPKTSPELRAKLRLATEVREYARDKLGLTVKRQYTNYADLKRDSAIYSVVLAEPFKLKTRDFCYPIAGCVPYRGFFKKELADKEAAVWRAKGYDVTVGEVDAFSTLGYLPDPLLNTFIDDHDVVLAELIFHELLHSTLYVQGDVVFNESLATAVEEIALDRWMRDTNRTHLQKPRRVRQQALNSFHDLIERARKRLGRVYAQTANMSDRQKLAAKRQAFKAIRDDYRRLKPSLGGQSFDKFILSDDFNNAKIMAVGVYDEQVPAFLELYRRTGNDMAKFLSYSKRIARMKKAERDQLLNELSVRAPGATR